MMDGKQERITLQQFATQFQLHRERIQTASQSIETVLTWVWEGDTLTWRERKEMLATLTALTGTYDTFLAGIEQSAPLPLAVIPLRLPLITALIEAKEGMRSLASLVREVYLGGSLITLSQVQTVEQAIEYVQQRNKAVTDAAIQLMDRARFTARMQSSERG